MNSFLKLCFIVAAIFVNLQSACKQSEYEFEDYLSTKTPYRVVSNKSFDKVEYAGCTPTKSWMLIRHGTRNPSASCITLFNQRLPVIKDLILKNMKEPTDSIHNRDLDLFKNWRSKVDEDEEKKLRGEGEQEMMLLAERMQSRFPEVFDHAYSNTSYKFKYTQTQRTRKSAYYFSTGLFGKQTAKDVWFPPPSKKDPILRFYKLCNKWQNDVKNQPIPEVDKFLNSDYLKNVVNAVNKRLNLVNVVNVEDLQTMYSACAFGTAWNHHRSPWCSAFSVEDLKVMEYLSDLKYYWIDGYGHKITYEQACPLFNDLIGFLTSEEKYPKVNAYFTHSGTVLKTLAHLGLYKDEKPLQADNFMEMDNRQWKTSKIDAFGSNLAFILYNCGDTKKVLTMHQENIIRLPICPDEDLCEMDKIQEYYSDSLDKCQFDDICSIK